MRSILSVSVSPDIVVKLKKRAKKADMSVSAYVVRMIEEEERLITEDEILERSKQAMENYKKGNVKELKSFDDILKNV